MNNAVRCIAWNPIRWNARPMSPWFERRRPQQAPVVHYVSAAAAIRATREEVWNFIKPVENTPLIEPEVVRAFSAPKVEGANEIQVSISVRDGLEHVSAVEVEREVPYELAITRVMGDPDPAARNRDVLQDAGDGLTSLEHGHYFTLPAEAAGQLGHYQQHYRAYCKQYVERVRAAMEGAQA